MERGVACVDGKRRDRVKNQSTVRPTVRCERDRVSVRGARRLGERGRDDECGRQRRRERRKDARARRLGVLSRLARRSGAHRARAAAARGVAITRQLTMHSRCAHSRQGEREPRRSSTHPPSVPVVTPPPPAVLARLLTVGTGAPLRLSVPTLAGSVKLPLPPPRDPRPSRSSCSSTSRR